MGLPRSVRQSGDTGQLLPLEKFESSTAAGMERYNQEQKSYVGMSLSLTSNNNNFPINDWYAFEVAKDAKGRVSLKTIATPLKDYEDSYHAQCPMK